MTSGRTFKNVDDMIALAKRLTSISFVAEFDEEGEPEAWALAHTITDLEESFSRSLEKLMPQLVKAGMSDEELHDVLMAIGEELRHILYHIENSKFYDYLLPPPVEAEA